MLPGSRFFKFLWLVVLAGALMAFNGEQAEAEEVLASWYGPGFAGKPTASGEIYDPNGLTAAHKTLPLGTKILVSYGDKTVPVTINDRGPFTGNRELDLSQGVARELGLTQIGVDYVDWSLADGSQSGATPSQGVEQQPLPTATQQPAPVPAETAAEFAGYPRVHPPAQETVPAGGTYTVQPGDTLANIVAQLGVSIEDLTTRNGIADPDLIYSGQALYLPLLIEAPSLDQTGVVDGVATQSPGNLGGSAGLDGPPAASPGHNHATPVFDHGAASPMAP